jgi:hypothetical protein
MGPSRIPVLADPLALPLQVAHEILALQIVEVLLAEPTDDSVEIAVNFVKEVGQLLEVRMTHAPPLPYAPRLSLFTRLMPVLLACEGNKATRLVSMLVLTRPCSVGVCVYMVAQEVTPKGVRAIFERFRGILHEGEIDKRVQYTIEGLFAVRKSQFADFPAVPEALDLVEKDDKITFEIGLEDPINKEEMLDVFRFDPEYDQNEKLWKEIKKVRACVCACVSVALACVLGGPASATRTAAWYA